jgi:tRNA(Ile)-lysidine synthase
VAVAVDTGPSPEGQARIARLAALEAAVREGETILTGHTADDQAETVLGNLLRGAGLDGLAGIPRTRGCWARPLLDVTRAETRELAGLLGLAWVDDPANEDTDLRRNLLRRSVIPDLEDRINPALRRVLARTAGLAAAGVDVVATAAARVPVSATGGEVRVPATLLVMLPPAVAAAAVRRALRLAGGPHAGRTIDVEELLAVAAGTRPRAVLPGGLTAEREGPWLVVARPGAATPGPVPCTLPGETRFGAFRIESWVEDRPPSPWPLGRRTAVVDGKVTGEAVVRAARAGDRIELRQGSKPVFVALAEAGVAAGRRESWPVVEVDGRVLWLVGVRTAAFAWVSGATTRYLWMVAAEENGWT